MKKFLFVCMLTLGVSFFYSCSKDDSVNKNETQNLTKVDAMVRSKEFQNAQKATSMLGMKIEKKISKLSADDKERMANLMSEPDPIKKLEMMGEILNIDFNAELTKLHSLVQKVNYDSNEISKKDILMSIERNSAQNALLKTRTEYDGWCVTGCAALMTAAMIVCDTIGTPLAWVACAALATSAYADCVESKCKKD